MSLNRVSTTTTDASSVLLPTSPVLFDREQVNLESHQLVWLDTNAKNDQKTVDELRKIVDYTKLFHTVDECHQFLVQTKDTVTFFISSGKLGEIIVPRISTIDFKNIWSIYIYCQNKSYHEKWCEKYTKVKQVYTKLDPLLNDLTIDVQKYLKYEATGIFSGISSSKDDFTIHSKLLSWWKQFITILTCLVYPENYHQQLVHTLKIYYKDKLAEQQILDEFQSEYCSERAIWWYTRPTVIYRLLNKALRQHNIELAFLFGSFIQDLYRQLKEQSIEFESKNYENNEIIFNVYRGQVMSSVEIQNLLRKNQWTVTDIVNNSFLSTSIDRSISLSFLYSSEILDSLERVLFEIVVDHRCLAPPFASISQVSYYPNESEILFMIGTLFKLKKNGMKYDESEKIWNIKLILTSDAMILEDEQEFDSTIIDNKRIILKKCAKWLSLKLYYASDEQVDRVFNGLINLYPKESGWLLSFKYQCLAEIHKSYLNKNYLYSISCYENALSILLEYLNDTELNCSLNIAYIYCAIAYYYDQVSNEIDLALKYYELAIHYNQIAMKNENTITYEQMELCERASFIYARKMAIDNENLRLENGLKSIKYKEQEIEKISEYYHLPYSKIARRTEELADVYQKLSKIDKALCNYDKAIELHQIKSNDVAIIEICEKIIKNFHTTDTQLIHKYQLLRHKYTLIYKEIEPIIDTEEEIDWKKTYIARSYEQLADSYISLNEYYLAKEHLIAARKLYEEMIHLNRDDEIKTIDTKMKNIDKC